MIKITRLSGPKWAPILVLIPGGPGLSSLTLRSLDLLSRSFHLVYVDFPGTNGNPYDRDRSFDELASGLNEKIEVMGENIYVLGHSFGGFFAAKAALKVATIKGIICISTPFTDRCIQATNKNFECRKTTALIAAENAWQKRPNNETFSAWCSEYGELYFIQEHIELGRKLLVSDPCSAKFFKNNKDDIHLMAGMLGYLSKWKGKKLFLAEEKGLMPTDALKADADKGGFEFQCIEGSSHFVMFDQPEAVTRSIEKFVVADNQR